MPKLDKGKVLLRCAAHALFVGLRVIPGVGMAVEIAHGWFDIFRDELRKTDFKERLLQLEEAAAISPNEARAIADEFIAEQRAQDVVISAEKANAICDLLTFMPATIKERTQATLRQARQRGTALQTVLPITVKANPLEQETFYRSLFPARRPRFQSGYSVPNGLAGWRLGSLLGTGGFGEVWEVRHERLRYAVKFFLDEVSERILKNEAKTLFDVHDSLPRHANIVHLMALNLDKPPYWLLFEFVEGGALESLLRAAPLAWQESLDLFRPIVEGVAAVHRIGIVHRDLKPANILLTVDGVPKITDFGIGKLMAENEAVMRVTRSQSTMLGFGSMGYMSKEQRRGEPAHPTDDTYALGVLLWQMLVQTLDAPDLDWAEELQQQDVPEPLKNVVFACLNKSREQRPADAVALLEMLPTTASSGLQDELAGLNRQLADLQAQEMEASQHSEAAQQRELARQRLSKEQEVARKQRRNNVALQLEQQRQIQHDLQKALAELSKFESTPRGRFEKTEEYERKHNILLNKQFDVPPIQLELQLLDYDADKELLQFQIIAEEVIPGKRYCTENAILSIAPKETKICWQRWKKDKQLLLPYFVLDLDVGVKVKAVKAGFETVQGQLYFASSELRVEKSSKAIAEEKAERERIEQAKIAAERERIEQEKQKAVLEQQKQERERRKQEKLAAERERVEQERRERERQEQERLAAERERFERERRERKKREREQQEHQAWQYACRKKTVEAYQAYLNADTPKQHVREAKDWLRWNKRLSPFNPVDYLRLLWWFVVSSKYLEAHQYEQKSMNPWLASTLSWLPQLIITSTLWLGLMPFKTKFLPEFYLALIVLLLICWLLTGLFTMWLDKDNATKIYFLAIFTAIILISASTFVDISNFGGVTVFVLFFMMIFVIIDLNSFVVVGLFVMSLSTWFSANSADTMISMSIGITPLVTVTIVKGGTSSGTTPFSFFVLAILNIFLLFYCFF